MRPGAAPVKEATPQRCPRPKFWLFPSSHPFLSNEAGSGLQASGADSRFACGNRGETTKNQQKPRRENQAGAGEAPKILPPAGQGRAPPPQFPTWGHPQIPETPPAGCIPNSKNNKTPENNKTRGGRHGTATTRPGRASPPHHPPLGVALQQAQKGTTGHNGDPRVPPNTVCPPP